MKTRPLGWCCLLLVASCTSGSTEAPPKKETAKPAATTKPAASAMAPLRAVAQLAPASGSSASGMVTFVQQGNGIEVHVHMEHLTPGLHGFHVHEKGDCSASDASSAGAHWNPDGQQHGDRLAMERHIGDLGNLQADAVGTVDVVFTDQKLALSGPNSIVDRALIVHANADDLKSQPSGNSGNRIACGVIMAQNTAQK